ncbi:MAG: alpha/beta hydrolase [Gordonia sp. (in: high G+C Gram-positive bacteria)]
MTVEVYAADGVVADVHRPDATPAGVAVLAHGAGGNRGAKILLAYAAELCARGFVVARIDLPYRQRRPKGPPSPAAAAADRDGIRAALGVFGDGATGPVVVGGHSYGGRQSSMLLAEEPGLADLLLLSSYPLHPPGKPERARTQHLRQITIPTVVVHGSSDPFATTAEIADAVTLITGPTRLVEIEKTGHDLTPDRKPTAPLAVDAVVELICQEVP